MGRAIVVHDSTGGRVACALIPSKLEVASNLPLATFDSAEESTTHTWRQQNDPVMVELRLEASPLRMVLASWRERLPTFPDWVSLVSSRYRPLTARDGPMCQAAPVWCSM